MARKTVLLVDDDTGLLNALIIMLRSSGYAVVSASDAVQATAIARRNRPDLVLLDIGLPGGGGFLVLERLRMNQHTAMTPVIVLTGSDPTENRKRAESAGAYAFFQKPADNRMLLATIAEALGEVIPDESRA